MQDKNFDLWNTNKKKLDLQENITTFFFEREIWWCYLGVNIGHEQNGKGDRFLRPVLILKKFNHYVFLCLPLTTSNKDSKYLKFCAANDNVPRKVIISQLRLIDVRRLRDKITVVTPGSFSEIRKTVRELF